jgi:flavin-binding protein dodecin
VKAMTVASVTEISAVSPEGFEEAIREGINRATSTLRNVGGAWVKDKNVLIESGRITGYKVNLLVTFVMEEAQGEAGSGGGSVPESARSDDDAYVVPTTGRDASLTSPGQEPPQ